MESFDERCQSILGDMRQPEIGKGTVKMMGQRFQPVGIAHIKGHFMFGQLTLTGLHQDFFRGIGGGDVLSGLGGELSPVSGAARHFQNLATQQLLTDDLGQVGLFLLTDGILLLPDLIVLGSASTS